MIRQVVYLACAALVLWATFKFGEAHALLRLRDEILDGRKPRRAPVEAIPPGSVGSGGSEPFRSSRIFDQEAELRLVDSP
jgi:hypothetical protein